MWTECLYLYAFVNRITKGCELELSPFKVFETCIVTYGLPTHICLQKMISLSPGLLIFFLLLWHFCSCTTI